MANYPTHPYAMIPSQAANHPDLDHDQSNHDDKKKTTKRWSTTRVSHMTCDEGRPCQRRYVSRIVNTLDSRGKFHRVGH
ncbi:hypothetical protein JVT61DRAFT_7896 [Boletus reticuloceps]|uniref:Uncharacterized protein n=1 Tax=Boletus reticuloceps TaxID=495285 RepID=A0A8I2YHM7_9AGAM|nr:hypothetical protein JVT61DRAFT_7896 [Boletus reticuloceps]